MLSGNRNFEGRIHPQVRASYLASPPLVVAYALAGSIDVDLEHEPLGTDADGDAGLPARHLAVGGRGRATSSRSSIDPSLYETEYARVFDGDEHWQDDARARGCACSRGTRARPTCRSRRTSSTCRPTPAPLADIEGARVLAVLGDSVTTDHISPAGSIKADGPAGRYLQEHGVAPRDFNSYGSRRGNHEVMIRGTFANIRLRNALAGGVEGGVTKHLPSGELLSIFDAAERYRAEGVPLVVLAGKEYGSGSSRDWAAKGTLLLGVRAVIAESYERIHRSNLVGMGVLPLQFMPGESAATYALTGEEVFSIRGLDRLAPGQKVTVEAIAPSGFRTGFAAIARVDGPAELEYLQPRRHPADGAAADDRRGIAGAHRTGPGGAAQPAYRRRTGRRGTLRVP